MQLTLKQSYLFHYHVSEVPVMVCVQDSGKLATVDPWLRTTEGQVGPKRTSLRR
jgi:hypothetical protein